MTNKEIAKQFQYLGEIMELHEENPFKIKSYLNAYLTIRKLPEPITEMAPGDLEKIKGIGSSTSASIQELLQTGAMQALKKYEEKTPPGVREMLHIPGFGPKKIRDIWKVLGVETIGELRYACNENRLVELKGFGEKTQEDLRQKLEYYQKSKGKSLFADLDVKANDLLEQISKALPEAQVSLVGGMRRRSNVVERMEFLVASETGVEPIFEQGFLTKMGEQADIFTAKTTDELPVTVYACAPQEFGSKLFRYSAGEGFLSAFLEKNKEVDFKGLATEEAVFEKAGMPYLLPELREEAWTLGKSFGKLLEPEDIRGVVHAHSTWSDGLFSIRQMAEHARSLGYSYLGITDHSKAAFYANGLKEDQVLAQWQEVDELNRELAPFRIFKGIESDILHDGSLDYSDEMLAGFDFIIASIHSNLRMEEEKATQRLLGAIENRHTTILGHPTGRLLLSRPGYPIDHQKIIDACAANGVAIELNANPYRLDLDWTWIPYALNKNVKISVNPDAHSTGGMKDIKYGVYSARKGGLTAEQCLTCLEVAGFEGFISMKK
ncbi:MAG: PHP domain-containing protein [Saprospiraceae bacterium]|nr:PHP domain-containing protein [Saprospiraceae bacterium]MCF8250204.1 PHP domain-containing protein [Saprospiraceae bacterium]MCF8280033.1 PHP domain-containing protein [Bacteroidales bacterium]MCF8312012.1 PHP domain-containing protein [Saprospiraceae bacterium]MCF8441109.1 PHP domain-containing protein [Saprospiraceae bacterium]